MDQESQATGSTPYAMLVRFLSGAKPGDHVLATFADPYARVAVATPLTLEALRERSATEPLDELCFVFLPGGSATPFEQQKWAEEWMAKPAAPDAVPTIELVMRSDRILWRPGRALMHGAADRADETLAGLVDFAFHEAELRRLEREVQADWPVAEGLVPLTHSVDNAAVRRQAHVDEMTEITTMRRMRHVRLERRLDKASITLPGSARRLVSELAVQSEVTDRLKSLCDQLEVFEDLCESANDRLLEYSYYRGEYRLELWIIVVLVLELVLILAELLR